jgi:hypothetical protein
LLIRVVRDEEVAQIAANAKRFAEKYLTDSHVANYCSNLSQLTSEYKQVVFNAGD